MNNNTGTPTWRCPKIHEQFWKGKGKSKKVLQFGTFLKISTCYTSTSEQVAASSYGSGFTK
jgi:hypothetical protein